jgi:hypothetical protein
MLTIFSCPKPFTNSHINIIQRNAIKSWTLLKPKPEIILLGNDEGVSEICREFNLIHIPEIERNEYGTPLLNSIFSEAEKAASHQVMCYINADIILMSDFMKAIEAVINQMKPPFLLIGRRYDLEINELLSFESEDYLYSLLRKRRKLHPPTGLDYFVFTKGLFGEIPPFAIGRLVFDNWLIWRAKSKGVPVVDLTPQNTVIHQAHDYSHIKNLDKGNLDKGNLDKGNLDKGLLVNSEIERNRKLLGRWWPMRIYTVWDSDYVLEDGKIKKASILRKVDPWAIRIIGVIFITLQRYYPYSYPILPFIKVIHKLTEVIRSFVYKKF